MQSVKQMWTARSIVVVCVVACATVAAVSMRPSGERVRTEDRNGDGRPDVWHHYDAHQQLNETDIDTNFDGRSDIQEYYHDGTLIRREADRNFNDQIDLVEEFDESTHEHVRSVIDSDFNGTTDLLVLFQHGQPVFSKQASSPAVDLRISNGFAPDSQAVHHRVADQRLAPLTDSFGSDTRLSAAHEPSSPDATVGLSTSGGLPCPCTDAVVSLDSSAHVVPFDVQVRSLAHPLTRSPRGPPLS